MTWDWFVFFASLGKVVFVIGLLMTFAALLTWVERKQSAVMQDRVGANRADMFGVTAFGLFHILADAFKMMIKEDYIPPTGNKLLHTLGPILVLIPALVGFAVIPFGDVLRIGDREISLQIAELNVGLLYIFAVASLSVYGITFGGWASNNRFALLGSVRAAAQMFSYEIVLGLSIIGVIMVFQSLQLSEIVQRQGDLLFGFLPKWGVFLQPIGFLIYITASIAETKRPPFDMPEAESEIIGYHVEYSGMKWGVFFLGEFVEIVVLSALLTTLFFGGWQIPWLQADGFHWPWGGAWNLPHLLIVFLQVNAFIGKVMFFIWLQMLIRWTLPKFRYDQVMRLGWKMLLPLALLNIFVTALVLLGMKG
jgi:NADH-quinone oxidoreductase subunit H